MILLGLLGLAIGGDEETFTLRLEGRGLGCEECRSEIGAILRKNSGYRSARFEEGSVVAEFDDASPVPDLRRWPRSFGLTSATLHLRGTVSFHQEQATLCAKGSHEAFLLVNSEAAVPPGPLGNLRKEAAHGNRFWVTASLKGERTLILSSWESADWKEK